MLRITISYRRDDSLDITGRIFDRLAAHFGHDSVFRDIDNIPPGADFHQQIDKVLDATDVILAIVGPRWMGPDPTQSRLANAADPVRFEIETALHKDKPLLPVLVSHAVMPSPEQLPESLRDFAYRNAVQVDSGQDFDHHIGRLTRAMERILEERRQAGAERPREQQKRQAAAGISDEEGQSSPAAEHVHPEPSPSRIDKRVVWLAGCVALSVMAVAVLRYNERPQTTSPASASPAPTHHPAPTPPAPNLQPASVSPSPMPVEVSPAQAVQKGNTAYNNRNYPQAMAWYRKAADHGDPTAEVHVGWLYENGWGVTQDYRQAMTWYRRAASQGDTTAQGNIGVLYRNGSGVAQDYATAMTWFQRAADRGNAAAQRDVGFLYENGWGVAQDFAQAMSWFRKAADHGDRDAQRHLGELYASGWGVAQDYATAMSWYRKAADQGDPAAEYHVGWLYAQGEGVDQNLAEARNWMSKAAAGGSEYAKRWLAQH